ncbi:MAG: hypothetical protein QOF42_1105 [Gammaproteobacteria bacterium]|nr:hypothetical protein [Gammaproteobacteria bacterium]
MAGRLLPRKLLFMLQIERIDPYTERVIPD